MDYICEYISPGKLPGLGGFRVTQFIQSAKGEVPWSLGLVKLGVCSGKLYIYIYWLYQLRHV